VVLDGSGERESWWREMLGAVEREPLCVLMRVLLGVVGWELARCREDFVRCCPLLSPPGTARLAV
jgi:hypothetical protein